MAEDTDSGGFAANFIEKLKGIDRKQLFFLLLIFLLAFGVRGHLIKYEYFFGFDSYWHARMVPYLIEDGTEPLKDPLAYYQIEEGANIGSPSPVFWFMSAFAYKVFTLGSPYDKDTWIVFVKFLPALFGALICMALFFFMKEAFNEKAGYAAAMFAAIVPSFVYRTMASFFEEDSLGFLWLIVGFYFLVKAVKSPKLEPENIKNAVLAGIFFGILNWTWGMNLMAPLVVGAFAFWTAALMWFRGEDKKKIIALGAMVVISLGMYTAISFPHDGGTWFTSMTEYVKNYIPITPDNIERAQSKGTGVLQQTIGEENLGHPYWGIKYNALIIFPILALFLIPYKILRDRKDRTSLIVLFWVMLALYMAFNKLKFTYVLGLPIAASAGVIYSEVMFFLKGRPPLEKKTLGIALAFMMLLGVGAGTFFVTQKFPQIEESDSWKDALKWARDTLPEDAKFFNWWDEGHWITFIAERGVIEDNRNYDFMADVNAAQFVISEDPDEAYHIVKAYGSSHVIMSSDLLTKQGSMGLYAYNTTDFSDPRLGRFFGVVMKCGKTSQNGINYYICGNNQFPEAQFDSIPSQWTANPNHLQDDRIPMFIYRNREKTSLFMFNAAANNTVLARLWFNDPSVGKFGEVYSNSVVKIFKVL